MDAAKVIPSLVEPAADVLWSAHAKNPRSGTRRSISAIFELSVMLLACVFFMRLNPGLVNGGLLSAVMVPMFLEGLGGFSMVMNSFLSSAKAMQNMRLECTAERVNLIDITKSVWSSRLDAIEFIAILAPREFRARLIPRILLIQTNADADIAGSYYLAAPEEHELPFLIASPQSLLMPSVFDMRDLQIADRLAEGAGLTANQSTSGVPNGLRVVRSWNRTPTKNASCREDPPILQRWRMFAGVCPVCRTRLPVLRWISLHSKHACHQCGMSLLPHAARIPVGLTTAISTSVIIAALNWWFSLSRIPYMYQGTFLVVLFTILYCLARQWSRYSAQVDSGTHCRECGYDLRGCTADRCSECGTSISRKADNAQDNVIDGVQAR